MTPNHLVGTTLTFPTWDMADAHVDALHYRGGLKGIAPVIKRLKSGEYELQFVVLEENTGKKRRK